MARDDRSKEYALRTLSNGQLYSHTMSQQNKIIILIAGAVLIFALIIGTIFDLFPDRGQTPETKEPEADLSFLDEPTPEAGIVFDESNADEFSRLYPPIGESAPRAPLESEARALAQLFIEHIGTFSSDAQFAHITDVESFMTPAMRAQADEFKKIQLPSGYYEITATVYSLETALFLPERRTASFDALVNRTETSQTSAASYTQTATIGLTQTNAGAWLVNGLVWGAKTE